jgi:cullin-associated NEDD8-dissociated protein 1
LITLTILLKISASETFPLVESSTLPIVYDISYSPLVSGTALEALTDFFYGLVVADDQIGNHVVPGLVLALEKSISTDKSPANVSKCISAVVRGCPDIAAGVIAEFAKAIKVRSERLISPRFLDNLLMILCVAWFQIQRAACRA